MDWLGQNEPVATPTRRFRAKACQVSRINGKSAKATAAITRRAAEHDTRAEPVRERAADKARGKCSQRTGGHDKAGDAEREPADVVQVDDQERPDDAVPEHVHKPARLQDPDVPRKLRIQAAKVGAHRARA